jgi:hypothetical protein
MKAIDRKRYFSISYMYSKEILPDYFTFIH